MGRAGSALISPSLAANGAGRTAWVSGTVTADVTGITKEPRPARATVANDGHRSHGTNNSSTHGVSRINTGYIVGCQVDITGLERHSASASVAVQRQHSDGPSIVRRR